jgi:predicted ATPase
MPWLSEVTLRGYKSIEEMDHFGLRNLNVFIGANGVGKSNFLSFFSLLRAIVDGRLERFVKLQGGANVLLHHGVKRTPQLSFELEFGGGTNSYALELASTPQDGLVPLSETVRYWDKEKHPERPHSRALSPAATEAAISDAYGTGAAWWIHREVLMIQPYHFHDTGPDSPLRRTSAVHDNASLSSNGENLASYLLALRTREPSAYAAILHAVRRVAPFIRDFVLDPLELSPEQTRVRWRHEESDALFDVAALSDGTLRFIALATVLLQPKEAPPVVIIDEPELGLHPVAIHLLGALMRSASTKRQLLVSTQSSQLLDEFEPEDVVVAELEAGATRFRRLETAALDAWLEDYSLGELWEKNELGGRPA